MTEIRIAPLAPTMATSTGYPARPGGFLVMGIGEIVALLVLLGTAVMIFGFWTNPDRAWLHPELATIGRRVSSAPHTLDSLISLIVDWHRFAGDAQRARNVTGLFEVLDAWTRPSIARVFAHPVLSITTVLYVSLVPALLYRTLRLFALSVAQATLFCALLIATPGFLSNLFAYIHQGKPLSFILIAATVFYLVKFSVEQRRRQLVVLSVLVFIGLFTDELLLWNLVFVPGCLLLVGAYKPALRLVLALVAVVAAYLVSLFLVLPWVYSTWGTYGEEPSALSAGNGEHPIVRMFSNLLLPDFYRSAAVATSRSLLAVFGSASTSSLAIGLAAAAILATLVVLIACFRYRNRDAWRLMAVALFGLCSFASFGMWLLWYNGPSVLDGFASLNYYYNSPISLFVVLFLAAIFKCIDELIEGLAVRKAVLSTLVLAACLGVTIVSSTRMFLKLNDLIRFAHLGPTDTATFFSVVAESYRYPTPPLVVATADESRFERGLARVQREGRQLFGVHLRTSVNATYYERSFYDEMPWYGPSYARFGMRYGTELCFVYFGYSPCPVVFREASPPASP